jgi:riboflavin kinase/FMN adenylyltransferase
VLDRDDLELYDEEVVVELLVRLRPMARFESVEELLSQMAVDVARARDVLDRADRR